jgi:hypothetical protein
MDIIHSQHHHETLLETCRSARRDGAMRRLAFLLWLSIHGPFANAPTLPQRVR